MKRALIIGNGITGLSCTRLLTRQGWDVHILTNASKISPSLLLNHVTRSLLQDIWQFENSFWESFHFLHKRQVCWGKSNTVMDIPQLDVVIKGNQLTESFLECLLQESPNLVSVNSSPDCLEQFKDPNKWQQISQKFPWIIDTSGRAAVVAQRLGSGPPQTFGHRCVIAQEVVLNKTCEKTSYWIETVTNAWVFLAPLGNQRALLQVMVPNFLTESRQLLPYILEQTLRIKYQISELVGSSITFSAFPQILPFLSGQVRLSGATWMAVGDAAFCVDPISGDGTGYAIRGAILATSIMNSMTCNLVENSNVLHHYSLRLYQAFLAHLKACISYYSASFSTLSWQAEIDLMQKAFTHRKISQWQSQELKFKLQGCELVELGNSS